MPQNEEWEAAVRFAEKEALEKAARRAERKEEPKLAREGDHATSRAAARKAKAGLSETQNMVLSVLLLHPAGLMDSQIRELCNARYGERAESSYRKRRSDLVKRGLVVDTNLTGINANGSQEKIWRALQPWEIVDATRESPA